MNNAQVTLSTANLNEIVAGSIEVSKVLVQRMGVSAPVFTHFIGDNAKSMTVDTTIEAFVVAKEADVPTTITFASKEGKQIIDYLMVVLPSLFPAFTNSPEFQALEELNLKGRLTAKAKVKGKKTRETVLTAALKMEDVYVVDDGMVLGKLLDFTAEEVDHIMKKVESGDNKSKLVPHDSITFYIAKDTDTRNLNSPNTLYQKMSGSLAYYRFAKAKKKKTTRVNVLKAYKKDGMVTQIEEPQDVMVLDEMCTFDGSGSLPFGEKANNDVLQAVFAEVNVVDKKDGVLLYGADVSEMESFSYVTYAKSMSQARSNGAVGFKTIEDIILYFLGTGQDEIAYAKKHMITNEEGNKVFSGQHKMDVAKAYKRFMLAASNGSVADKGLLKTFSIKPKVEYFAPGKKNVIGEIQPAYIVLTNHFGDTFTIALLKEFYAQIEAGQEFLLNVLDESNAFVGVEKFKQWDNQDAIKALLKRNLTDGQGWHSSRTTKALRTAGVINSFDAFQLRISNAVKGASLEFDPICELFGADLILTEGMVKAEEIVTDIKKNGFQLFVVGQRKDGANGIWAASQATQQLGLTVEELQQAVTNSVDFVKKAIEEKQAGEILTMLNADDEESDTEYNVTDYVRLAEEHGEVLDEQYIKDQVVSLGVKKLNKLLDAKVFTEQARTRYMFSDVFAIYNAAKAGRYTVVKEDAVLKPYEVIAPAKKDGNFFLEQGRAISVRFPVTVTHEIPVVTAVHSDEYTAYVSKGLWQGVTFFDAFSWVVAQQAGADHDGDTSAIIFDEVLVNARVRQDSKLYGSNEVLPFIDAYVKYDKDGKAIKFKTGCPDYATDLAKSQKKEKESYMKNGFKVEDNTVYYDLKMFEGKDGAKNRRLFLETVAELSKSITVNTIEASLIGVIANRAMILTDLLTRSVLTKQEQLAVEVDLVNLCAAGRWEIDRPKHGGAYLEMPLMEALFANFDSINFTEEEMDLSDEEKYELLARIKGAYRHIFTPVFTYSDKSPTGEIQKSFVGFRVSKPQWLASQKDEAGMRNMDSAYQVVFGTQGNVEDAKSFSELSIEALCDLFKVGHSNVSKNNIRRHVIRHMGLDQARFNEAAHYVQGLYMAYSQKENVRSLAEKQFRQEKEIEMKKSGLFGKKILKSLTKAKKTAKLKMNAEYEEMLSNFSNARDLYKAEFRKAMYELAKNMQLDIRSLVGALYLVVSGTQTNGKASSTRDGREFRFVPSNGFIALPFEVFAEEMSSLISGRVSETYFFPQDLTFTLLQSNLVEEVVPPTQSTEVKVRALSPNVKLANKTVAVNRPLPVVIKPEQQKGETRLVMYFLHKNAQVTDAMDVTREDAAYIGFAPQQYSMAGIYEIPVKEIAFNDKGTVASVRF